MSQHFLNRKTYAALLVCCTLILTSACAKTSDFGKTGASVAPSSREPAATVTTPPTESDNANSTQLVYRILPGATMVSGGQVQGYLSVNAQATEINSGTLKGRIEIRSVQ